VNLDLADPYPSMETDSFKRLGLCSKKLLEDTAVIVTTKCQHLDIDSGKFKAIGQQIVPGTVSTMGAYYHGFKWARVREMVSFYSLERLWGLVEYY
jgi:hypothetical protein